MGANIVLPLDELELKLAALDDRRGRQKVDDTLEFCVRENLFPQLLQMLDHESGRRRGSISWILARAAQQKKWCPMDKEAERLINGLAEESDVMSKRCTIDIFQYCPIPEQSESQMLDQCIKFIRDPKETVAVRAFSITVLFKLVERYPELFNEVKDIMTELGEHDSGAIRVRVRKALEMMEGLT